MALDRWIAVIFLAMCCAYGYVAFFTMDHLLPLFMQRNPVWPSTFPKILSILGIVCSLIVISDLENNSKSKDNNSSILSFRQILEFKIAPALMLIGLMALYALLLRPMGFLLATSAFLVVGSVILGERKGHIMVPVAFVSAVAIWYLVQQVLGIFLRPWPYFL